MKSGARGRALLESVQSWCHDRGIGFSVGILWRCAILCAVVTAILLLPFRHDAGGQHEALARAPAAAVPGAGNCAKPKRHGAAAGAAVGWMLPARLSCSVGKTLYVAPVGNDHGRCTIRRPCQTLLRAFALARAGTTIDLRGGTYSGYQIVQSRRFPATNPVTLQSYPGEMATFTGCPSACSRNILYFGNTSGIRIRNITVTGTNNTGSAIKLDDASYMELDGVVVHDVFGNGVFVVGNTVPRFAQPYSDHIQIWNSTFFQTALNAGVATNQADAIYIGSGEYSDGVKHGVDGFVIANNRVHDQPNGFAIQVGNEAANGIIVNNTFDHTYGSTGDSGSSIIVWGKGDYPTNHVVIANNLMTNSANHGLQANCPSGLVGIDIHSNLAYHNAAAPQYVETYGGHGCFTVGKNIPDADPLYVNAAAADYRLQPQSPALGQANPAYAPPLDAAGVRRGSRPAVGALGVAR